jgi:hypothetical protein
MVTRLSSMVKSKGFERHDKIIKAIHIKIIGRIADAIYIENMYVTKIYNSNDQSYE